MSWDDFIFISHKYESFHPKNTFTGMIRFCLVNFIVNFKLLYSFPLGEDWLWYSNCKMCVVLDFLNLNFFINNFLLINDLVMCLFPPTGDQLLQPWGRTVSDGVWVRMSTRRCLKVAGVGLWPWPSLWWRSVPTGSSRAWVSFSKISWKSLGRATVECPGSSPYLPSSLLSPVSGKHLIYYPINTTNW